MKKYLLLLLEEFFPFIFFIINKHNKLHKTPQGDELEGNINEYSRLSPEKLNSRLSEEHERAIKIDEKTAKFTLGLSVSLTILSTASGTLAKLLPVNKINWFITLLCGLSSIFMMIAGIVSLGALKTLPKFGYGTQHELLAEKKGVYHLAKVLIQQEDINIVRHLRNETAYQCLRNGFIILLIALILSVFLTKYPSSKHGDIVGTSTNRDNAVVEEIRKGNDNNSSRKQLESIRKNPDKVILYK